MGRGSRSLALIVGFALLWLGLNGCSIPQVNAEDRLFLGASAEFLGEYRLPQQTFQETTVGGLSAIAYHPLQDRFYALSDDRGSVDPPRFYRLKMTFSPEPAAPAISDVTIEAVTLLKQPDGSPYPTNQLDPEGLALSPRQTVLISSEGIPTLEVPPAIQEFELATGRRVTDFRLPERFLPDDPLSPTQGIQNNLSLESLAINATPTNRTWTEPFRLFTAPESALVQDYSDDPSQPLNSRLLHYLIGEDQSTLLAEYRYPLDLEPSGALINGLTELVVLDQGGHFLALERAFGLKGFVVKLYQLAIGGATDTSTLTSLKTASDAVVPIRKRLLFDFANLPVAPDNLEGMTLGPRLPDGSQSLVLISDNNFEGNHDTQLLLFRLTLD